MVNYQLSQVITEPTRVTATTKTLIDVFITNKKESIIHSGVYPMSISDHNLIYAVRKISIPRGQPRFVESRNFKTFNETKFITDLENAPWPYTKDIQDVNCVWDAWKNVFLNVIEKHAPCRIMRVRNKPSQWINSEVKQEMFQRDWLKKHAIKTCQPDDWKAYKKQKICVDKKVKRAKKDYYEKQIKQNSGDPRATWKILNDLMGKKSNSTQINELETETDPEKIAECLNIHFTEIGPKLALEIPPVDNDVNPLDFLRKTNSVFALNKIKSSDVLKKLKEVNIAKATGHDKISNKILKIAAPAIFKSLTDFFNFSIVTNIFPIDWKIAKVSPLYKSGKRNDPNNYRPISVLSTIARVFERLIFEQMYTYFTDNKLIEPRQSGFRSLHSTVTALLDMTNQWCFNIDRGMVSGVIFLDLKKAFDTVNHDLLLKKLNYYGVQNQTITWFKSYLADRQQLCKVNGVSSAKSSISCGVPQGSILGPLLFLIYINDLPTCLDYSTGRSFADDTNLTFSAGDLSVLQSEMSEDLNKIFTWLCSNKLTLNTLKTDFMVIGSRQRIATLEGDIALSVNGITLEKVRIVNCLGLSIDEFLTWDTHMQSIKHKVTCNIRILKRIKPFLSQENLITLYKSIVEPYLSYCCIVWDSISDTLANNLQKLQNRAARIITGASYYRRSADIRHELGWLSLVHMRQHHKAIMMFKVVNGLCPTYLSDMFTFNNSLNDYSLRSSRTNLELPKNRTNYYKNSFAFSGAKVWNALPSNLKEEASLERFKTKLKSHIICTNKI